MFKSRNLSFLKNVSQQDHWTLRKAAVINSPWTDVAKYKIKVGTEHYSALTCHHEVNIDFTVG